MQDELHGVLHSLPEREREVIRLRYGLVDGRQHTLAEVGSRLGLTRERIRQIEIKAIRKLRHHRRRAHLETFIAM